MEQVGAGKAAVPPLTLSRMRGVREPSSRIENNGYGLRDDGD